MVNKIWTIASFAFCFAAGVPMSISSQTSPSAPPALQQSPKAHTNFQIEPLGQQTQEMKLESPLEDIKLDHKTPVPGLRMISLPSDQVGSSADVFARFAIATGNPLPQGAKLIAHTNVKLAGKASPSPDPIKISTILNNTPSEIEDRYGLRGTGNGGLVVLVDAYDYRTAESDLARFSLQFKLPQCTIASGCLTIKKVDPVRTLPDTDPRVSDCGWSIESALDLQWAHAISPRSKLILVEAATSSADDLFQAVKTASAVAESAGGGVVSLSWSFAEVEDEAKYDILFQHDTVLYLAASGDQGGVVEYPAASPFVISVGGTKVTRDSNNKVLSEVGWDYSGGGFSIPEIRPPFQNPPLENVDGTTGRVTPDIAGPAGIDRLLDNGSPMYAGTTCNGAPPGWYAVGGTSLATPIIAAAASLDFPRGGKTETVLGNIYAERKIAVAIRDITFGRAGNNFVKTGYDAVTGVGVPASLQFALPPSGP
jgi:hypothetical protein